MTTLRSWALALASASLIACSSTNAGAPSDDGGADATTTQPATVTQTVGASGGTVSAQGLALTIPPGALPADTSITIAPAAAPVPAGYTGLSPLYAFGPNGTVFLKPVQVAFTLTTSGADPTVYWSNASGGYDALATSLAGTTASASVTHFSEGFVGVGPTGSDDGGNGGSSDAGTDATTSDDSGAIVDSGAPTDSAPATDATTTDAGNGESDDSGAVVDAGPWEAGTPGIHVTIDGVPTTFDVNAKATTNGNSVWTVQADTNGSGVSWHIEIVTLSIGNPTTTCSGGAYPQITYTDFLNGGPVATFQTRGSCSVTVDNTPTAADAGQQAAGTFSGTVVNVTDGGIIDAGSSHVLTNGVYDGVY